MEEFVLNERPSFRSGGFRSSGITGGVKSFLSRAESKVRRMGPLQYGALLVGGVLLVDHLIAPKGQSYADKVIGRFTGGRPLLPPPSAVPPPGALAAARGDFTGANRGAGAGWGYMPYGGWGAATPAGPQQYAHAVQPGTGNWYNWEG